MEKIVLIGGGGHCKVIIDILRKGNKYEIVGICDRNVGDKIMGVPVIGDDSVLPQLLKSGIKNAFICIGALGNPQKRINIMNNLVELGFKLPTVIHPKAIISEEVLIEDGTCVMAGAVINAGAKIGKLSIINTSSVVEHDCVIEQNVHISPRACICGSVTIRSNTHIGAGSTIIQEIKIGKNSIIGAGAVVIRDIEDNSKAVGVPAKIIKA